jgi:SecD/SecF fusion protein
VVVDGEVVTAPVVRAVLTGGVVIVEGGFTMAEAETLARTMRAAAPAPAVLRVAEQCRVAGVAPE